MSSMSADTSVAEARLAYAPARRFSSTFMRGNTRRFSGTSAMPFDTTLAAGNRVRSSPFRTTEPEVGDRIPAMVNMVVVLPAPLGPSRQVISPSTASRLTPRSASMLP